MKREFTEEEKFILKEFARANAASVARVREAKTPDDAARIVSEALVCATDLALDIGMKIGWNRAIASRLIPAA